MIIHPTYDPLTATWFAGGVEAPSLRKLKALLPPRTKLVGYFPQGYAATRAAGQARVYMPVQSSFRMKPARQHTAPVLPAPTKDEAILNDWANGMSADTIANRHGILNQQHVLRKIKKARLAGDPRARMHIEPHAARPKHNNHEAILNLWAAGLTGPEIGERLNLRASTTAGGIVAEYRKKGDARAKSRSNRTGWE